MQEYEPELVEITERVWESLVDVPLKLRTPGEPVGARGGRRYTAGIQITGAWEGAVTVHCSEDLAKLLTGAMFGMAAEETADEDVRDALGELANMIGGNVKGILPEPSRISLPAVADGADFRLSVPGTVPVTAITWSCSTEALMVRLLARGPEPVVERASAANTAVVAS